VCQSPFGFVFFQKNLSFVPLQATLEANERRLTSLDPCWKLEYSFLKDMLGEAGFAKLQADFLAQLPTKEVAQDLAASVQGVRLVLAAQLFKFVPKPDQGQLSAAYGLLARMQQGFAPTLPKNPCPFLQDVWARLPFFARATRTKGSKGEGKKAELVGAEAVRHMLTELAEMSEEALTLEHIEKVAIFSFLLSKPEEQTLQGFVDKVTGRAGQMYGDKAPKALSSKAGSPPKSSSSKRKRGAADEVEAAANMFR
jgi:hypothetical protein